MFVLTYGSLKLEFESVCDEFEPSEVLWALLGALFLGVIALLEEDIVGSDQ